MKKVNSFLLILLFFITTMSFAQVNLKNGLVACYPFNANAKDESGNNNNGTVNGGVTLTTDRFGKTNSSYTFNGIDGFINVPDAPSLKFEQISIAMWIKATQFRDFVNSAGTWDRYGGPICRDTRPAGTWNGFTTTTSHGLLRFNSGLTNGSFADVGIENSVNIDEWTFLVFIVEDGISKVYKNGVLLATNSTNKGNKMSPNNNPIFIGRSFWLPSQVQLDAYFTGQIDDIHLYNRPLNAAEIKALYDGNPAQTITITASNSAPCGGDKITFTANGASSTAKYQWKLDGVNQGTNSKIFDYTSVKKTGDYTVKITVEVTDEDICFPQKPATKDLTITVKDCTPPATGVNLKTGLVACYPFNGNAKDETDNRNDGTVNGAMLTTDRFGKANSAYSFDGNSYIQLANPDDFKNNTFTYSAWVKMATIEESSSIFFAGVATGMTHGTGVLNRLAWAVILYNNENVPYDQPPSAYINNANNEWHHIVLVRSATQVKIYVDGVLERTSTTPTPTTPNYLNFPNNPASGFKATIGTRPGDNNIQFLKGLIDDIHIYNRPLNEDEIKELFKGKSPGSITISANNSAPCGGDKITFTANGATNTSKYQWKVDGVNQGTNSKTFDYNSPNKSADYQVKITVEVTDEDVCFPKKPVVVDKIVVLKNCVIPPSNTGDKILIPTAFTPNGDGTNDVWELTTLAGNGDLIVEIYNRWGEIVFYSKGYSEPWNGTYKGSPVPEGTYAYVVRVDAEKVFRGAVLVVR